MAVARIRFGPFELDCQTGELFEGTRKLPLQEQSFRILLLLLEKPGELVAREQLQRTLWPGQTFVDFDHGLNNVVKRLRETLRDSAEQPRYIETLRRRGYRFIAPVDGAPSSRRSAMDS